VRAKRDAADERENDDETDEETDDGPRTVDELMSEAQGAILAALDADDEEISFSISVGRVENTFTRKGGAEIYLFECGPDEVAGLKDRLRDVYGTGTYRIRIRKLQAGHPPTLFRVITYRVEALPKPATGAALAPGGGLELAIAQAFERQNAMLGQVLERVAAPPRSDGLSGLKEIGALFAVFMDMQKTLSATSSSGPAKSETADPMKIFREGMDFAREYGGQEREAGAIDLAMKFLESPIAEQFLGARGTAAAAVASAAPGPPAPPNPAAAMVEKVLELARQNAPIDRAADFIFENTPPLLVRQFATADGVLDQIVATRPDILPHVDYVRALRDTIRNELNNDEGDNAAGDAADAENSPAG
jgi:hypothetical protein